MLFVIIAHLKNIKTDIYSLIDLNFTQIIQKTQHNLSYKLSFLTTNPKFFEILYSLDHQKHMFKDFTFKISPQDNAFDILDKTKIATLEYPFFLQIRQNPQFFFEQNALELFNSFIFRPIQSDFFNLSSHSSLLNYNKFQLDLQSLILNTNYENKVYYLGTATLNPDYDSKTLLELIYSIKQKAFEEKEEFIITGNELFSSYAKTQGNQEGIYMGIISLVLIGLLLFLAFQSLHILKLLFIIGFSFLSGLCATFLILGEIHILSIVVSTSLIGLVLDFAMHWLGEQHNKKIIPTNINSFKNIFLLGLIIACGGYAFFLFSPMNFLHEIAIISIFGLLGAFCATYFLIPLLLQNVIFKSNFYFESFICKLISFCYCVFSHFRILLGTLLVLSILIFIIFMPKNFEDNIKNYSSMPQNLIQDTQKFLEITGNFYQNNFIILRNSNLIEAERELTKQLIEKKLIQDYEGISKFVLSIKEQEQILDIFRQASKEDKIISFYTNLDIAPYTLKQAFEKINTLKIYTLDDLSSLFDKETDETFKEADNIFKNFLWNSSTSLIFLKNPIVNKEFNQILKTFNADYIDVTSQINQSFTQIKINALWLKICAYLLAFLVLWIVFDFKKALMMIGIILLATLISIAILMLIRMDFNIFSIFGFILAGTIGIDYVIFALNNQINLYQKFFGIILANLTSLISFSLLSLSQTYAIFSFGISVSLCMFFCAFFALLLACKENQ
ncbi:MAG: hypothetical protein J1E31_03430 [Helicobacter sp.]|nr:hypothetical protein [Helicobacter sp.]